MISHPNLDPETTVSISKVFLELESAPVILYKCFACPWYILFVGLVLLSRKQTATAQHLSGKGKRVSGGCCWLWGADWLGGGREDKLQNFGAKYLNFGAVRTEPTRHAELHPQDIAPTDYQQQSTQ